MHCARHIYANWKKDFKGEELKLLFWGCVKSYNVADFNDALQDMTELNRAAADEFRKADPNVFCRPYLKNLTKCDTIVSNMVETFNNYIMRARSKHLIDMLDDIRTMLIKRLVTKKEDAQKWVGSICPKILALLEKEKEEATKCTVMPATTSLFQVAYYFDTLEVDLDKRSYTCGKWDLKGIPCRHAIATILYKRFDVSAFVDRCYTKEAYLEAYSGSIPPLAGDRYWPKMNTTLLPPPIKLGPGRPRKNRRKSAHEDPKKPGKLTRHGLQMSYRVCGLPGHNKRKCPDKDTIREPSTQLIRKAK